MKVAATTALLPIRQILSVLKRFLSHFFVLAFQTRKRYPELWTSRPKKAFDKVSIDVWLEKRKKRKKVLSWNTLGVPAARVPPPDETCVPPSVAAAASAPSTAATTAASATSTAARAAASCTRAMWEKSKGRKLYFLLLTDSPAHVHRWRKEEGSSNLSRSTKDEQ